MKVRKALVAQSCLALLDPSPARILYPWNSPGKNTGMGSHSFLHALDCKGIKHRKICILYAKHIVSEWVSEWVKSLNHVRLFAAPWTVVYQAPPSMGFSRQEYWSGLPFPSPGNLPDSGIEPRSPALQADALTSKPSGKPKHRVDPQ